MEYTISYKEMLSSEQKFAYSLLCSIDQPTDSYLINF
jgi:hypothetical protein